MSIESIEILEATEKDLLDIIKLKQDIWNEMEHKEWYVIDGTNEAFLKKLLQNEGLILKAIEKEKNNIIGFLIVEKKISPNSQLAQIIFPLKIEECIEISNVGVHPNYRGRSLQRKMIQKAERLMLKKDNQIKFSLATVHPDNQASLHNLITLDYQVKMEAELYHGKKRYIVVKKL